MTLSRVLNSINGAGLRDIQLRPIALAKSVFASKSAVPRQGSLSSAAKVVIEINNDLSNAAKSLIGLEEYSHVWLIFQFHKNRQKSEHKTLVAPPKYDGLKTGMLATRSPHRFNPIGLTLAKIENIDKNTLTVSSVDVIDGTPILDIKPYFIELDTQLMLVFFLLCSLTLCCKSNPMITLKNGQLEKTASNFHLNSPKFQILSSKSPH